VALVAVGVGLRLVEGTLDLATGLFAIVLAPEAYLPLRRLGAEFHASEEGLTAASRVFAVLDTPAPTVGGGAEVPDLRGGRLVVEGVSVVQPGRDAVAPCCASLEVGAGEVVAVVGPSGAGKSTLLAAILGFVPPDAGRVALVAADGTAVEVAALDGEAWRRKVGWLPQQPYLFEGTVAANVRLAAPEADDHAVTRALAVVGLGGLDPRAALGERGAGLSSGERRRVGVARALLRGAPLLLLDEPTAGLDAAAEAAVLGAVRAAADAGAAVLLGAHRPAAAAMADRIVEVGWEALPATAGDASRPAEPAGRAAAGLGGAA
jgi:ABC-type transport system involved in cytochrome bd biosynthesis fused ATPase/permease subunit